MGPLEFNNKKVEAPKMAPKVAPKRTVSKAPAAHLKTGGSYAKTVIVQNTAIRLRVNK
jgi:hypothetical protein